MPSPLKPSAGSPAAKTTDDIKIGHQKARPAAPDPSSKPLILFPVGYGQVLPAVSDPQRTLWQQEQDAIFNYLTRTRPDGVQYRSLLLDAPERKRLRERLDTNTITTTKGAGCGINSASLAGGVGPMELCPGRQVLFLCDYDFDKLLEQHLHESPGAQILLYCARDAEARPDSPVHLKFAALDDDLPALEGDPVLPTQTARPATHRHARHARHARLASPTRSSSPGRPGGDSLLDTPHNIFPNNISISHHNDSADTTYDADQSESVSNTDQEASDSGSGSGSSDRGAKLSKTTLPGEDSEGSSDQSDGGARLSVASGDETLDNDLHEAHQDQITDASGRGHPGRDPVNDHQQFQHIVQANSGRPVAAVQTLSLPHRQPTESKSSLRPNIPLGARVKAVDDDSPDYLSTTSIFKRSQARMESRAQEILRSRSAAWNHPDSSASRAQAGDEQETIGDEGPRSRHPERPLVTPSPHSGTLTNATSKDDTPGDTTTFGNTTTTGGSIIGTYTPQDATPEDTTFRENVPGNISTTLTNSTTETPTPGDTTTTTATTTALPTPSSSRISSSRLGPFPLTPSTVDLLTYSQASLERLATPVFHPVAGQSRSRRGESKGEAQSQELQTQWQNQDSARVSIQNVRLHIQDAIAGEIQVQEAGLSTRTGSSSWTNIDLSPTTSQLKQRRGKNIKTKEAEKEEGSNNSDSSWEMVNTPPDEFVEVPHPGKGNNYSRNAGFGRHEYDSEDDKIVVPKVCVECREVLDPRGENEEDGERQKLHWACAAQWEFRRRRQQRQMQTQTQQSRTMRTENQQTASRQMARPTLQSMPRFHPDLTPITTVLGTCLKPTRQTAQLAVSELIPDLQEAASGSLSSAPPAVQPGLSSSSVQGQRRSHPPQQTLPQPGPPQSQRPVYGGISGERMWASSSQPLPLPHPHSPPAPRPRHRPIRRHIPTDLFTRMLQYEAEMRLEESKAIKRTLEKKEEELLRMEKAKEKRLRKEAREAKEKEKEAKGKKKSEPTPNDQPKPQEGAGRERTVQSPPSDVRASLEVERKGG